MKTSYQRLAAASCAAILALCPLCAGGRPTLLPDSLAGSMMPYDFSRCDPPAVFADSLTPVYASYTARHGSRYLSGKKKVEKFASALAEAREKGTITATGEAFSLFLDTLTHRTEGNWGALSPLGTAEEKRLAAQAVEQFAPLTGKEATISATSTFVPRAVMTMYEFTHGIIRLNDNVSVATDEGRANSPLLYFFDVDPDYDRFRSEGDWKQVYGEYVAANVPGAPARRMLGDIYDDLRMRELTMELYGIIQGNAAASLPAPTTQWMSAGEYRACWKASNLRHYLRNSVSPLSDLPAKAATPLLLRIISDTDRALEEREPAMDAYFGHAETLLPLFALMELPGCHTMTGDYATLDREWRVQDITPLAANLMMIILRGPSGAGYAALRLNGRNIRPLPDNASTIVPWRELRENWIRLIAEYNKL